MEGGWEFLTNTLLVIGAGLHGDASDWSDGRKSYHWSFINPVTCTESQVWMTSQEMLKDTKVRLYVRTKNLLTDEVAERGRWGGDEIEYRVHANSPPEKDIP